MLQTKNIQFKYDGGPSFHFPDISCEEKGRLLILGESGKGKTTLLHLISGLLQPTSGEVTIKNQNTSALKGAALDRFRGKHVGIIFQTAHFVQSLTVLDNLLLPPFLTGSKIERSKALEILQRLNLKEKAFQLPSKLSVGEAQRVAIARAIINNPSLILADEPTSALDDKNAIEVIRLLEEQASTTGAALVIVTHDQRLKDHFKDHVNI